MVRDLNDPWVEIRALKERIRKLETATPLQDASVTRGRLRVASDDGLVVQQTPTGGAGIRVTGLQVVDGTLRVTGTLEGAGSWTWTGPWNLAGTGTISGNTTGTGTLTWTGPWNLNGVGTIAGNTTGTGDLTWNGPWKLVGAGEITGNVKQTGNTDQQGTVTLSGANGRIIVTGADGNTVIKDSKITFPNGTTVRADVDGAVISQGGASVGIIGNVARMRNGTSTLSVFSGGFAMTGLPTVAMSTRPGSFVGAVVADNTGNLSRVVAG